MILSLFLAATLAAVVPACSGGATPKAAICRALKAQAAGHHAESAAEFERAASVSTPGDPAVSRLLAAAGNMWIAADRPGKAALALDRALVGKGLFAEQRGEALFDRARAAEAQGDFKTARARVGQAAETISGDPFLWYFSAALALREEDVPAAKMAIGRALALAPADPAILFEAGHVASLAGEESRAREYWTRASAADPKGATGQAAKRALAMTEVPITVSTEPSTRATEK